MPVYTLGALDANLLDRLDNNTLFYTQAERYRVINEAMCISNAFLGWYQISIEVPGYSRANQLVYNVPSNLIFPLRVQFEGRQLDRISLEQIGKTYWTWMTDTTVTRGPVAHWVPMGVTLFCLHPIDARGGGDIVVTGVGEPPTLTASGQSISIEDEYAQMIVDYAAHRLPLKEGGKVFADAAAGYQNFLRTLKEKKMWMLFRAPKFYVPQSDRAA